GQQLAPHGRLVLSEMKHLLQQAKPPLKMRHYRLPAPGSQRLKNERRSASEACKLLSFSATSAPLRCI
ncbi:MAG: hypothetical protein WA211_02885, partial [Candidatus Acidiferrales bacterium]